MTNQRESNILEFNEIAYRRTVNKLFCKYIMWVLICEKEHNCQQPQYWMNGLEAKVDGRVSS